MRRLFLHVLIILVLFAPLFTTRQAARAQDDTSPCGVVDAISYPIDGISIDHDDFGLYRASFGGRHAGIDMAFDRYGEPVHAAARGRVTYADPNGWDTEKGVVIIEHFFPDDTIMFSLYGHMEQVNGYNFPKVGQCVELGDVVGAVGHPSRGAPHLHYEIRRMKASAGGPGYYPVEPLDGGWMHPIDFTERWQLELKPAFRSMLTASGGPTAPPIFLSDSSAIFAEDYHLEHRSAAGDTLWRLDVARLTGIMLLPDNRILGRTSDDQIVIVADSQFSASWKADRALASPPIRLGNAIVFVAADNRIVSYTSDGALSWQTDPLGGHIEQYAISGDRLAVCAGDGGNFRLWVVDSTGKTLYQASAPAPILPSPAPDGFYIMVATQIGHLDNALNWQPMIDTKQALGRGSQLAVDANGNIVVYPGHGQKLFAFNANGSLRWQTLLTGTPMQPPLLGVGSGCLIYALTDDGALLAYRATDGQLRGLTALYAGGNHGNPAARWLRVLPNEQVQFSAGYLSIATVDGPTLAGLKGC